MPLSSLVQKARLLHQYGFAAGWTDEEWKVVETEMSEGNYDHALQVVMRHFKVY